MPLTSKRPSSGNRHLCDPDDYAESVCRKILDRQPVIIDRRDYVERLDPKTPAADVTDMLGAIDDMARPPAQLRKDVSAGLSDAIVKALSPKPDDRYPDMESFEAALGKRAKGGGKKNRLPLALAAGILLMIGAGITYPKCVNCNLRGRAVDVMEIVGREFDGDCSNALVQPTQLRCAWERHDP